MPDIFAEIEMPNFLPLYDSEMKYGYKNAKYKRNLKNLLNNTSNGFCMYCYIRIELEGRLLGHLEHSICPTAHCGRSKPQINFCDNSSPIAQSGR